MIREYATLMFERGIPWAVNRGLYSLKLKTLRMCPSIEHMLEPHKATAKRVDLFEVNTSTLSSFLNQLPDKEKQDVISKADQAISGRIQGFSAIELDYGQPINWQMNPLTGKATDVRQKWYRIPDFDPQRGDIKVIWEASRLTHFFLFARALLLTGDSKYYQAFSTQLGAWLNDNPYSYGANFKCGQECALRMMTCLMVYPIFKPWMTDIDTERLKEMVSRCYRKILNNFFYASKCIKNNHTISELAGMIAGAWCCMKDQQMAKAYRMLDQVISEQFLSDGGYVQQSFNYQRLALQDLEFVMSISRKTGYELSDQSKKLILSSAQQMYQCQDTSGDMPNYGSNDGALIFPVTCCGYRDFSPVINTTHALLCRKQVYDRGKHIEELIWMGCDPSLPYDHINRVSKAFPESGLFTLRSGDVWAMLIAKKTINHMDEHHLDVWANGKNVFCDGGTHSYASEIGRLLFAAKGHNTVICEGKEQVNRLGAFAVYGQPKYTHVECTDHSIESDVLFSTGYRHKRTVMLLENKLEIDDCVEGVDENDVIISFHTPCTARVASENVFEVDGRLSIEGISKQSKALRSLYYLATEETTNLWEKIKSTHKTIIKWR